jgi:hypothetical protein
MDKKNLKSAAMGAPAATPEPAAETKAE